MKKGRSILSDVMARTGITVEEIAEKTFGKGDTPEETAKNIDKINQILEWRTVVKRQVELAVKNAGGTEDEVLMAGLIVGNEEFKKAKAEHDALVKTGADEALAAYWAESDEKTSKPLFESWYNRGPQLLAEYKAAKAKEEEKKAKKAAAAAETTVETPEAPVAETVTNDPFDN